MDGSTKDEVLLVGPLHILNPGAHHQDGDEIRTRVYFRRTVILSRRDPACTISVAVLETLSYQSRWMGWRLCVLIVLLFSWHILTTSGLSLSHHAKHLASQQEV